MLPGSDCHPQCLWGFMVSKDFPELSLTWRHFHELANLIISELPYFVKNPDPLRIGLVGSDLELECQTGGDPAPRVVWIKPGHGELSSRNIK